MTAPETRIDYSELERFAAEHSLNAAELIEWAMGDPTFPERYLQTHGKVNFGTYLKIREFMASKIAAGTTFAAHNEQTAGALTAATVAFQATDATNAVNITKSGT